MICASMTGALTSITGSLGKQIVPSRMARTWPVNSRSDRYSRKSASNWPNEARKSRSSALNLNSSR